MAKKKKKKEERKKEKKMIELRKEMQEKDKLISPKEEQGQMKI